MSNAIRDTAGFDLAKALQSYARPDATVTVHLDARLSEQIDAIKAKLDGKPSAAARKKLDAELTDLQAQRAATACTFTLRRSDNLTLAAAMKAVAGDGEERMLEVLIAQVGVCVERVAMYDGTVIDRPLTYAEAIAFYRAMSSPEWERLSDAVRDGGAEAVDPTNSPQPSGDSQES